MLNLILTEMANRRLMLQYLKVTLYATMFEGGKNTNTAKTAENTASSISENRNKFRRIEGDDAKADVKQDSENLKKDSMPEFPAIKTSSTIVDTLHISNAFNALTLSNNKYVKTAQTLEPVSRACQEEWTDKWNNLEFPAPKSSILTPVTVSLSKKQYSFGDTSTSQFLGSPTSESKESARDNAESRSTPFCWKATTTTTLSSPAFQVPTAAQTLHKSGTSKSSILKPPTFNLSKKQYSFGDTSTSQFLGSPTSKSKESACDNAESRSTPFWWKSTTTTTLSSPAFQVPNASQTLHNSGTPESSILVPTTFSLSNKQCEFDGAISRKSCTSPVLENKPAACDSTPTNQKETTYNTTLGMPTVRGTLSVKSVVSGDSTVRTSTGESTPLIRVHQKFIFNAIPTEPAVMPGTRFNFPTNMIPPVSTQIQISIDSTDYTFNGPNPELAAFPQCPTTSSFSISQPVTQSQQLSTSSSIPLECVFNFDSSPGDHTAEPGSIQSEGFNFNPNTRPSFRFSVYEFKYLQNIKLFYTLIAGSFFHKKNVLPCVVLVHLLKYNEILRLLEYNEILRLL
ncbi:serine-rich adhesin for platelets-like [Bombus pascuorum]|uniref:serine-rich adhesin for platelets-like n=1 Tax=Bombus pascuorum TaxID=65598 RepID=UPI00298E2D29|nr:serine-rich adhesin for platelets-like [Bombus pascuorum]